MHEIPLPGETDDESSFFPLLQKLIVELPPVASPVYRVYPFIAHMGADHVDHFEELVILADKTSGFLGVRFQIQGNHFLVIDVGRNRFGKPVPLSNLVLAPIVDLAETLHLRGMLLPDISWINRNDHIIQNILASVAPDEENREENSYEYQTDEGLLIVTAPEELVLKIQTIVQDEATFDAFNNGSGELAVDVISVVSPVFLEKDYNEAVRLGGMNSEEISKFLASLDRNYRYSDKKCWYNESIGTITVVDDEENLYRAWDYMNKFPYIPKEMTY